MDRQFDFRIAAFALVLTLMGAAAGAAGQSGGGPATNHIVAIDQPGELANDAALLAGVVDVAAGADAESPGDALPVGANSPVIAEESGGTMPAARDAHESRMPIGRPDESVLGLGMAQDGTEKSGAKPRLPGIDGDFMQVFGALAVVVALLVAFRFIMTRASGVFGAGRPSGVLQILARFPIARGQYLSLLKVGRRVLLVHQSGSAMTTLSEINDAEEVASLLSRIEQGSPDRDAARFRSMLKQFEHEYGNSDRPAALHERMGIQPIDASEGDSEIVDLTRSRTLGAGPFGVVRSVLGIGGGRR